MGDTPNWRFMEQRDIADATSPDDVYLRRWILAKTPWCGVMLHHILRPDADRALHDHPWSFASIILRGGYREQLKHDLDQGGVWGKGRYRDVRWFNFKRAEGLHRITRLHGDVWSLVLHGPRRRTWGFAPSPNEWIDWRTYCGVPMPERNAS